MPSNRSPRVSIPTGVNGGVLITPTLVAWTIPDPGEPNMSCMRQQYSDYLSRIGVTMFSQLNARQAYRLAFFDGDISFQLRNVAEIREAAQRESIWGEPSRQRRGDQPQTMCPVKDEPNQ